MEFFRPCMESVFDAMNVRRSGPEDYKETYVDMTMMVEVPEPDMVAAIDVSLVALLFDNARMAVKSATPSRQVHFPRQELALATKLFEDVRDNCVAVNLDSVGVKVKTLYPADEDGNGAKIKLLFSFVVPEKRLLALLAELIAEPIWFIGTDSAVQDDPKKKKKITDPDYVEPLEGQESLFKDEVKKLVSDLVPAGTTMTVTTTDGRSSTVKRTDGKLHAVK